MQSKQRPHAPNSRRAEQCDEKDSDKSIADGALAPALEHCRYSNEKETDGEYSKPFEQHDFPQARLRRGNPAAKGQLLQ